MSLPRLQFGDEIYFHDPGFISWQIRAKSHGPWNHVAVCMDGTVATEAVFGGMRETPIPQLIEKRYCVVMRPLNPLGFDRTFSDTEKRNAWDFWLRERDSGYDVKALAGFLFLSYRNRWQSDKQWFCSEWATALGNRCGVRAFNDTVDAGMVSPVMRASSPVFRPVWYRLPSYLTKFMNLNGVEGITV